MRFEREGKKPIDPVSEKQLRRQLSLKRGGDNTFAILEDADGSYVQMFGGGVGCCLEWRDVKQHAHFRATQSPPKVPWREPSTLGTMRLSPEEFFFIEQVTEAFVAFLHGKPFPPYIVWNNVTADMVAAGVAPP